MPTMLAVSVAPNARLILDSSNRLADAATAGQTLRRKAPSNRMSTGTPPISVTDLKGARVVNFTDSKILDEANIKNIGDSIAALIDESPQPRILLDFTGVDHLSSAALGMLINANKRVKEKNGMLRLAHIKPQIYDVFVITKLNMLFKILPTRDAALDSFANTV